MAAINQHSNDRIRERLVALTRDLMLIPSIPSRPEEVRRGYEFVKNHLESLDRVEVREFESQGVPSLVATPHGIREPDVLMCAHLDVITHPDPGAYRSRIENGRIYGPGSGDMKGALAILLEIFRAVHTQYSQASVGLLVTTDEETGGACGARYLFEDAGVRCGRAMIPDGGSLNQITIEEKGILHLRLSRRGRAAHAARPWLGENPIEQLMQGLFAIQRLINGFQDGASGNWRPTCAVTIISTENQTNNRIPSHAEAVIDLRFPAPHRAEEMIAYVRETVGPDVDVEVLIGAEPTHLAPDPVYAEVTKDITGEAAITIRDDGGSDARFLCALGIPVLMSRPLVGNLHAEDEWIDIQSMVLFYRIYEQYLLRTLDLSACD
ncbi:MAG: M20 family metallopeptidase [Opitutales bacterium]